MTPTKFLWYSLIGVGDVFILLCMLSAVLNQLLLAFRKAVRITWEERKKYLDELDPTSRQKYQTMN